MNKRFLIIGTILFLLNFIPVLKVNAAYDGHIITETQEKLLHLNWLEETSGKLIEDLRKDYNYFLIVVNTQRLTGLNSKLSNEDSILTSMYFYLDNDASTLESFYKNENEKGINMEYRSTEDGDIDKKFRLVFYSNSDATKFYDSATNNIINDISTISPRELIYDVPTFSGIGTTNNGILINNVHLYSVYDTNLKIGDSYIGSQYNTNLIYQFENGTTNIYRAGEEVPTYKNIYKSKPDYLDNYVEIELNQDTMYAFLSGLKSGYVFIPKEDFENYGGKLAYYDLDLKHQPYNSIIQEYGLTPDGLYYYQKFDLNTYTGADFVVFHKFIYLENIDYEDFSYNIYVPNNIYISLTKPEYDETTQETWVDYEYIDENGDIIQNQNKESYESDSGLNNLFSQIIRTKGNEKILNYFSTIWEKFKETKLISYFLLMSMGAIGIYLINALSR